jgi:hypothetical protein
LGGFIEEAGEVEAVGGLEMEEVGHGGPIGYWSSIAGFSVSGVFDATTTRGSRGTQ